MPSCLKNMFNLRLCNAATIWYYQLKFGQMHLCGMNYKYFSPHCYKCNSFGCTAAIRCGNAYRGPHSDSLYSGSEHSQFNSPRQVKHEAGFPNPRRAPIGSNQLWRVIDSPYYRELQSLFINLVFLRKRCITDSLTCHANVWRFEPFCQQWKTFASEKWPHCQSLPCGQLTLQARCTGRHLDW